MRQFEGIETSKLDFKVKVNPFTRSVNINVDFKGITYTIATGYEDIDQWDTFELMGRTFDIQYHYEAEFLVSIYDVIDGKIDYESSHNVELTIKLTD